jgi:hypothetical protein
MRKPLKSGRGLIRPGRHRTQPQQRHEGKVPSRDGPATEEGKPLKAEAQGRYRRETKPERLRVEQGVKRLRKPEGAAQLGEVNPVSVATRFCKRRRAPNPKGGGHSPYCRLAGTPRACRSAPLSASQFAMGTIAEDGASPRIDARGVFATSGTT